MSNLSVEGKLKRISAEQVISDRFKKREFCIETEEQYPQVLQFQLTQDKTNLIDQFNEGDKVEIFFNLRGREWQKDPSAEIRVFNTLDAWRIQKVEAMPAGDAQAMASAEPVVPASEADDLPF
jgi:translation initiation factor IF-3